MRIGGRADFVVRACTDAGGFASWDHWCVRSSRTAASAVAWAMAAGSVLLVCWAVPVAIHDGLTWHGFLHETFGFSVVLVATMPILGAFLVTRHPGNRLGWVFCLYGPLRGIEVLADVWMRHDFVRAPGSWPGGPVATWLLFAGPFFLLPAAPLLTLWFPDGRAPAARSSSPEIASVTLLPLARACREIAPREVAQLS